MSKFEDAKVEEGVDEVSKGDTVLAENPDAHLSPEEQAKRVSKSLS
jgi:hypothetical protein